MERSPAKTLQEAFWALDPMALTEPQDPWFVRLDEQFKSHRYGLAAKLRRCFTPSARSPKAVHVGVVGHKGSGKTTQVRQVLEEMRGKGLFPVYVDALSHLDRVDFAFPDVVLVICRNVAAALADSKLDIPEEKLKLLEDWFAEELLTEQHRTELLGELKTEAKAEGGIPFLARLMAKVTAVLKTDNEYRQEIRRRVERNPEDLIRRANLLLDAALDAIRASMLGTQQLIVVLDNLEKIENPAQVDRAVLRRAQDIRALRCHLVLFFDPANEYSPGTVRVSEAFNHVISLPMLPVRDANDAPDHVTPEALAAVHLLLARRLDMGRIFADVHGCVREVTRWSGGRLRDVFKIARLACELADPEPISVQHIEDAVAKLSGELAPVARTEDWARLAEIHRDKQVANREDDSYLLLHSLVLHYNGKPWWDVHPLVLCDRRFEEAWTSMRRSQTR